MSDIELKPCPFCGGEAQLIRDRIGLWRVGCKKCKCMTTYQFDFGEGEEVSQKKAANVWNTRKPMERIVGQLEERKQIRKNAIKYEKTHGTVAEEFQQRKAVEVIDKAIEIVKSSAKQCEVDAK